MEQHQLELCGKRLQLIQLDFYNRVVQLRSHDPYHPNAPSRTQAQKSYDTWAKSEGEYQQMLDKAEAEAKVQADLQPHTGLQTEDHQEVITRISNNGEGRRQRMSFTIHELQKRKNDEATLIRYIQIYHDICCQFQIHD